MNRYIFIWHRKWARLRNVIWCQIDRSTAAKALNAPMPVNCQSNQHPNENEHFNARNYSFAWHLIQTECLHSKQPVSHRIFYARKIVYDVLIVSRYTSSSCFSIFKMNTLLSWAAKLSVARDWQNLYSTYLRQWVEAEQMKYLHLINVHAVLCAGFANGVPRRCVHFGCVRNLL